MKKFAQLFEFEDIGQVLVMAVQDDDAEDAEKCYEMKIHFDPEIEGANVSNVSLSGFTEEQVTEIISKEFDKESLKKIVLDAKKEMQELIGR